jgi:hypothetical protein
LQTKTLVQYWNYEQKEADDNPGEFELLNPLIYLKNLTTDDYYNLSDDVKVIDPSKFNIINDHNSDLSCYGWTKE